MKKIAKLSLVAAVAVAGLTTANAQPLEEAIKNVEVSGSVVYRYNDYNRDTVNTQAGQNSDTNNNYKVALNLSSKVNEDVKFNSRFLVANGDGGFVGPMNTQTSNDSNPNTSLSHAYFGYTGLANTTVNVGKQGLTTPWTVAIDSDGGEQTGTGILALSTVGPVTLAAAYFNQTNLNTTAASALTLANIGANDIVTVGAIANLDVVTLDAWYLDLAETFDSYTIGAKSDLDLSGIKLGIDARYASLSLDDRARVVSGLKEDNSIAKIALTAKAGIVNGKLAYAMTDKDGGLTALDDDANTTLLGWNLTSNGKADADYWQAVVGVDVLSNLNLSANYGNVQWNPTTTTEREQEEIYAQLVYKMSKNLSTYVRYGLFDEELKTSTGTTEVADDLRGRLQVEYTF